MRLGVYIDNTGIRDVDCSHPMFANPGIGGTEYSILLFVEAYKKYYAFNEIVLFTRCESKLPAVDEVVVISNTLDLPNAYVENNCDVLLLSYSSIDSIDIEKFLQESNEQNIRIVFWGHNFYFKKDCDLISNCKSVKANVFVGKQQYDRYVDHKIINKSTFIFNMYPFNESKEREVKENAVTYIGSLVESKGFHILASQWKKVLKKVPDAQLYVIGNGRLYSRDQVMGKYGIAESNYERIILAPLTENNEIIKSVHFLGILGSEKKEIVLKTLVGVVNPTGKTETFGISAIDFESMGVPVVTIAKDGFLDTVIDNKTGLLFHSKKSLSKTIIKLLKNREKNNAFGEDAKRFSKRFDIEEIIPKWNQLFESVLKNEQLDYIKPSNFYFKNFKIFRIINRRIKKILRIRNGVSVIGLESLAWRILGRGK